MGFIRLRAEIRALRDELDKLHKAIEEHAEAIHAAEERKRHERTTRNTVNAVVAFDDKTIRDTQTENHRQYRTQNSIRRAAWCAFFAATIYAFIAAYQANEMRKTALASQGQLALMRDADRPWVTMDVSISSPLTYDSSGVRVNFNFTPSNIGHSPAQNIWIDPRLTPAFMGDDLTEVQKGICEKAQPPHKGLLSYLLFPGQHYTQPIGLGMSVADINSHWGKLPPSIEQPDPIPIALVGCVDYTYESSPRHHQTGFALDVLMRDGRLPLKSKTPLAPQDLILREHSFGGHFAN